MNKVAIVGASGFVGRHLSEILLAKNISITALSNSNASNQFFIENCINYVEGSIASIESLEKLSQGVDILIILAHIEHPNESNLVKNLVSTCVNSGVKRIIYCSSAVVVGDCFVDEVTEVTVCNPISAYEKSKYLTEQLLIKYCQDNIELVILRPTAIFGEGGKNLVKLANSILNGSKFVNYVKSSLIGYRKMNLVCINNVTAALYFLIISKESFQGDVFIISDDDSEYNNYKNIERYLTKYLLNIDKLLPRVPVPRLVLNLLLIIKYGRKININRTYSCKKIENYGFVKPEELLKGLKNFSYWINKT